MKIDRRRFVRLSSISLAALSPALKALGKISGALSPSSSQEVVQIHILEPNLINLKFYFFNVEKTPRKQKIIIRDGLGVPTMVVRLPQQHVFEESLDTCQDQEVFNNNLTATSVLSGYSYLAFELYPDRKAGWRYEFDLNRTNLLNWGDSQRYKLKDLSALYDNKIDLSIPASEYGNYDHLKKEVSKYLSNDPWPICVIDLPGKLLVIPESRVKKDKKQINYSFRTDLFDPKTNLVFGGGFVTAQLLWNNQLAPEFVKKEDLQNGFEKLFYDDKGNFLPSTVLFRSIAVIDGTHDLEILESISNRKGKITFVPSNNTTKKTDLPSIYNITKYSEHGPDLLYTLSYNPIHFTGLGGTTRIKYENPRLYTDPLCKILADDCREYSGDIVRYIHNISLGRDEYIEVAKLGDLCLTGQKILYVKIGKRVWKGGKSFVEYIEKVQCIEPTKDYTEFKHQDPDSPTYRDEDPNPRKCIFKRILKTEPLESPPIVRENIKEVDGQPMVFWPLLKPTDLSLCKANGEWGLEKLEDFKFNITFECHNGEILTKSFAFQFLSACLFVTKKAGVMQCESDASSLVILKEAKANFEDEKNRKRHRVNFQNQKISYAKADFYEQGTRKDNKFFESADGDLNNKITELDTEFIDLTYDFYEGANTDNHNFPTTPQGFRARVHPESLMGLQPRPVPVEAEYSPVFARHLFGKKNVIKSFLNLRNDFINSEEYAAVKEVFTQNVKNVGGLMNPDIAMKTIALVDEGITLTDDYNRLVQNAGLRIDELKIPPIHIFRGDEPEIFGIKIIPLLEDLGIDSRPVTRVKEAVSHLDTDAQRILNDIAGPELLAINNALSRFKELEDAARKEVRKVVDDIELINAALKPESVLGIAEKQLKDFLNDTRIVTNLKDLVTKEMVDFKQKYYDARLTEFNEIFKALTGAANAAFVVRRDKFVREVETKYSEIIKELKEDSTDILKAKVAEYNKLIEDFAKDALLLGVDETTIRTFEKLAYEYYFYKSYHKVFESFYKTISGKKIDVFALVFGEDGKSGLIAARKKLETDLINLVLTDPEIVAKKKEIKDLTTQINDAFSLLEMGAIENLRRLKTRLLDTTAHDVFDADEIKTLYSFVQSRLESSFFAIFEQYYELRQKLNALLHDLPVAYDDFEKHVDTIRSVFRRSFNDVITKPGVTYQETLDAYKGMTGALGQIYALTLGETYKKEWDDLQKIIKADLAPYERDVEKVIDQYTALKDFVNKKKALITAQREAIERRIKYEFTDRKKAIEQLLKGKIVEYKEKIIADPTVQEFKRYLEILEAGLLFFSGVQEKNIDFEMICDKFQDVELGFIRFERKTAPKTQIITKSNTYLKYRIDRMPPVVEEFRTNASCILTNFRITVFNSLIINFNKASFTANHNGDTNFDVDIGKIEFAGALTFLDSFKEKMSNLGNGFILDLRPTEAEIGYFLAIPAISTPTFNFFNLSLGASALVPFDGKRAIAFKFSVARRDAMFGLSVGIYAGFGYFSITAEPRNGITELEIGMEFGGLFRFQFGPIAGHIKLTAGFYYRKRKNSVYMSGYIICEGYAKIWIIEGLISFYMGVISTSDYAEGRCVVSVEVRLGRFFSKSFSHEYTKRFNGSKSAGTSKLKAAKDIEARAITISDQLLMNQNQWEEYLNSFTVLN